jgi:pyruvate oxidase
MSNVCDVLVKLLSQAGVRQVFGVPGDAINALLESIRQQEEISFIHVNHEESGAFAAAGQAKLTGKLGVCAGTAGPGAIHLLNGLYDAKCDRTPVLAITGQVETRMRGSDYQQEINLLRLFDDVAVFNQTVTNPENFGYLAAQAIQAAIASNGVAHLNIPLDIASMTVPHADKWQLTIPGSRALSTDTVAMNHAKALVTQAEKPVILAGIGTLNAADKVFQLAERIHAPIVHALRAKELYPESHPYSIGGIGMLGIEPAVEAMKECDLLVMIGTNFPYVDFLPKHAHVLQIDHDARQIGKRLPVDVALVGDSAEVLAELLETLPQSPQKDFLTTAQKNMQHWRRTLQQEIATKSVRIHPRQLAYQIGEAAQDDAIFVCDTGEVTGWVARYLQIRHGQRFTVSGMLATMAFSTGAALGAQLAYPGRQVIALAGDGGFSMLMTDFSTAVKYELPIVFVVFNNTHLGMISIEQESRGLPNYETDLKNPDFAEFAKICGGEGQRVTDPAALPSAIAQAFASNRPTILDVMIDPGERFIPPRVTLTQAFHYAVGRAKEMI